MWQMRGGTISRAEETREACARLHAVDDAQLCQGPLRVQSWVQFTEEGVFQGNLTLISISRA